MNLENSKQSNSDKLSQALDLVQTLSIEIDSGHDTDELSYWNQYPKDMNEFMTLMAKVEKVKSAVTQIQNDMKSMLAHDFKDKAVKVGDKVIVGKPQKTWKPYDKQKVMDYVGDDWKLVVNPTFRTTGIKALAKERGQDPNTIFESLFYAEESGNVTILPNSKAPKYLQELSDLEVKELKKRGGNSDS
jgi:hypothetical protein